ncbi:MAG: TetR/AcrR family transcriptional regulator, partial [Phenylobacterium sp.]|nr:TetR/AcrR family transcriptional regulator [Phenylobacterium sp.]
AAGLELVRKNGASALTTRACAQWNGVSSSAVFRHFRDRRALLRAVAAEGFAMLARTTAIDDPALTRQDRLLAIGGAYLRFAIEEPNLFRLMYGGDALDTTDPDPDLEAAADPLLAQTALAAGAEGDTSDPRTLLAWSIVHGLAMLTLDNQLEGLVPSDPRERADRLEAILVHALPLFADVGRSERRG